MPLRLERGLRRMGFSVFRLLSGEVHDDRHLGNLRGLEGTQAGHGNPPPDVGGAVGVDAGNQHRDKQQDGQAQGEHRQPAEGLIVDLGDDVHNSQACPGEQRLPQEVEGGVLTLVIGRGVGGGKDHDHADASEQQHQHQKGQIHGTPGQLLLHGQIALAFCQSRSPPSAGKNKLRPSGPGRPKKPAGRPAG